jgi:hypothetical protein
MAPLVAMIDPDAPPGSEKSQANLLNEFLLYRNALDLVYGCR